MSCGACQPGSSLDPVPRFIFELESWPRTFLRNLWDTLLRRGPRLEAWQDESAFWQEVFVNQEVPVAALRQSLLYHIFVVVAVWGLTVTWLQRPPLPAASFTRGQTITYYKLSEYLPALSSPAAHVNIARKGEPEYAKQPIISVPELPDNTTQTIVDPTTVKLIPHHVKLPNLVAWTKIPSTPVDANSRSTSQLTLPALTPAPVAPAAQNASRDISQLAAAAPPPSVVQPALDDEALKRKVGDLNIGRTDPTFVPPRLQVPEQRSAGNSPGASAAPDLQGVGGSANQATGQLIALGIHPEPPAGLIEPPGGNRRGIFAATPEGKPGAPGTPDIIPGGHDRSGELGGAGGSGNVPAGIYVGGPAVDGPVAVVGKAAIPADVQKKTLMAAMGRPHLADMPRDIRPPVIGPKPGTVEDEVFGTKKYYSMILNMPNLTSGTGSWIIRFAELKQNADVAELTAPVALQKVDPAYPPELIRSRVEGTVVLYAVIHSDGSVGEVRVLRSVDERLDENARAALAKWHFRPATKHGAAVDLEAVFQIPFALPKIPF